MSMSFRRDSTVDTRLSVALCIYPRLNCASGYKKSVFSATYVCASFNSSGLLFSLPTNDTKPSNYCLPSESVSLCLSASIPDEPFQAESVFGASGSLGQTAVFFGGCGVQNRTRFCLSDMPLFCFGRRTNPVQHVRFPGLHN